MPLSHELRHDKEGLGCSRASRSCEQDSFDFADSEEVDDGSSNELLIMILKELVDKVSNESSVEEVEGGGNRKSSHTTHPSVGDYRQSTDDDDDNVRGKKRYSIQIKSLYCLFLKSLYRLGL